MELMQMKQEMNENESCLLLTADQKLGLAVNMQSV